MINYLEKLLNGQKVEWRKLGEVVEVSDNARKPVKASLRVSGNIPYFGANNIQDYVDGYTHDGEYVLIAEDGSASLQQYSIQWAKGKFWANNHVHIVQGLEFINNRFLYHYLRQINFIPYLTGGDRAKLTKAKMLQIPIPIPPLSVQKEIVKILDKITELEATLEAELTLRRKQYDYYRNALLDFNNQSGGVIAKFYLGSLKNVEWKTLGDIGIFTYGYIAKAQDRGNARFIRISDINQNGQLIPTDAKYIDICKDNAKYILQKNDLLMARTGATFGKTLIFNEEYLAVYAGFLIKLDFDKKIVLPKYYWHFAQSNLFWQQANKLVSGGGQPQFNANVLKTLKMPVPPLDVQNKIVAILDKFEALTQSISEGLPREIALRRKQYEYYREQLLNFPKP